MDCTICHNPMTIDLLTHADPAGNPIGHDPFHRQCIDDWYRPGNSTCPLCRQVVDRDDWIPAQLTQ